MKKPVLEYRAPDPRSTRDTALALRWLSAALVALGFFSLLLLMVGAWRFAALFAALGLLLAFRALRGSDTTASRVFCWIVIVLGSGVLLLAVLGR